VGITTKK
jgi:hypothetical protein